MVHAEIQGTMHRTRSAVFFPKLQASFPFRFSAAILAVLFCSFFLPNTRTEIAAQTQEPASTAVAERYAGDQACAKCHQEIYTHYQETAIGLNLCKALYTEGKRDQAREAVERVLEFNPDLPEAKMLLQEVNRAQH